ncbi:TM0106 family RecB-like putative nuclease, partial [Candidatus Poribacteria bacterium]
MNRAITSEILVSYSQCPRKAYLLLCANRRGMPHEYVRILQQRKEALQREYIKELKQKNSDVQSYSTDNLKNGSELIINAALKSGGLDAKCGVLTKVDDSSVLGKYSYEPTLFIGTYRIDKYQKLELFFVGYVLEQIQSKQPTAGRIISMDGKSHKVKLEGTSKTLVPLLEPLQEWAEASPLEPPPLILNKQCSLCQFQVMCREQAEEEDNLSLLDAISTPRAMRGYEKKGIFTVNQLSYTFKPRKRKKRAKNPPPIIHKPELQALAIRTGEIYLQEKPDLPKHPTEIFVDIEGVPDQQFYYLIGVLVREDGICTYHAFWSDMHEDEFKIWRQFKEKVDQHPDVPIYHYGSYEPKAIEKLARRYETDVASIAERLINVNTCIFGKVYFPVRSNRLKELGDFIGASWTSPDASGLQSLVWRHYWDKTRDMKFRELLVAYNQEDCEALRMLKDELTKITESADELSGVDFATHPEQRPTEAGEEMHGQFRAILNFSSLSYDKKKISFRQEREEETERGGGVARQEKLRPTRRVPVPMGEICPICKDRRLRPTKDVDRHVVIDIVPTRNCIRKRRTEYIGTRGYCPKCNGYYAPPDIRQYGSIGRRRLYGHGLKAWVTYQRVALRLSYNSIAEALEENFDERVNSGRFPGFIQDISQSHVETEEIITNRLLGSHFIHADETSISIEGFTWYVWVFTDGEYVILKLRETREATIAHEFLANYQGILVSDFYSGYDSIPCEQQKCWVHLIRNLNNDLREHPFDYEYEIFTSEVRDLIIPIMEAVQKYGLRRRHLNKFRKPVDRFYKKMIVNKHYKSDLVLKYQKRFIRYRDSLFTFLEYNDIPWHNNTAERAISQIVLQRKISRSFSKSVTPDFLRLLSIRQTCRFQGKPFFKFLFSGEKDIDQFKGPRRAR